MTTAAAAKEKVLAHLAGHEGEVLERLKAILRFPSVSTDPAYAAGMKQTREFLLARLREIGLADVQLLDGGGQPTVYGTWLGAEGAPTLIVYGHYDVQPPDPLDQWKSPPFEPTVRDGRLYARGASDVKGSTTIAVETIAAWLKVAGGLPVNIKMFIEGEEETGSPSLPKIVERYRALLAADGMLSADGGRAHPTLPTVNTGSRGLVKVDLSVRTAGKDMHSGRYGGTVRNALHEIAGLVATLHDDAGRIAIPEFLATAPALTPRQRADAAALGIDEAAYYAELDAAPYGDPAYSVRERVTLRPTVEVNGLWGGYTGPGSKTVIPCEAHAKLTMRLVPGQDPKAALAAICRHLEENVAKGVRLTLQPGVGAPAASLADGHPLLVAAETVIERTTGRRPVHARLGGTIPITAVFKEMLGLDSLAFGYSTPDEDVHAPNEFFRLSSIPEGLRGWTELLAELARFSPGDFRR